MTPFSRREWARAAQRHQTFLICAAVCVVVFGWLVTQGTGRFVAHEPLADAYDYQALSLVHGHFDIPLEAASTEAFVLNGRCYLYFGLTPALLRIPFVLVGAGFGQLSRLFMMGYFAASLTAAYAFLRTAVRIVRERAAEPSALPVALLTLNVGLGSTLLFLGTRAYVYHEAILCGVVFALWSVWCTLRFYEQAQSHWWIGSLVFGTLAVHARPPLGLWALAILVMMILAVAVRQAKGYSLRAIVRAMLQSRLGGIAVLAGVGTFSFNMVGYLKFGTWEGCPLRYHIQYTPERLAHIGGGKLFVAANIPFSVATYLFDSPLATESTCPFIGFALPRTEKPGTLFDLIEPTVGIPYAMPGLLVLVVIAFVLMAKADASYRRAIAIVWLGSLPMFVAMFSAIAISHRYTADFCPLIIVTAAFACGAIDARGAGLRRFLFAVSALLTAVSIVITIILSVRYQGEMVWGVSDRARERYAALRQRVDAKLGFGRAFSYDANRLPIATIEAKLLLFPPSVLATRPESLGRALAQCDEIARDFSHNAAVNFEAARFYAKVSNHLEDAVRCYERGLQYKADDVAAQTDLGELLCRAGKPVDAIPHLEAAVRLLPGGWGVHHDLGVAYAMVSRYRDALRELEVARQLNPTSEAVTAAIRSVQAQMPKAR